MVALLQPKIAGAFLTRDFNKGFSTHYSEIETEIQPNPTVFSGNLSVINVFSCKLKKTKKTPLHLLFINFRQREKKKAALSKSINNPPLHSMLCMCGWVCVCVCNMWWKWRVAVTWGTSCQRHHVRPESTEVEVEECGRPNATSSASSFPVPHASSVYALVKISFQNGLVSTRDGTKQRPPKQRWRMKEREWERKEAWRLLHTQVETCWRHVHSQRDRET